MFFHQRFIPGLAIASYMVGDEKKKTVAVIDPTRDVDEYIRVAKDEGLHITHILAKLGVKSRSAATDYAHRHGLA